MNTTIDQLPLAGPITGNEFIPVEQDGITVKTLASSVGGGALEPAVFTVAGQSGISQIIQSPDLFHLQGYTVSKPKNKLAEYTYLDTATTVLVENAEQARFILTYNMTSFSAPDTIYLDLAAYYGGGATSILFPKVEVIVGQGFSLSSFTNLTEMNLPELKFVNSNFSISNCTALTTFTMPNLIGWLYSGTINFSGCSSLANFTLGTVGILKVCKINGLGLTDCSLTQTSVDNLLVLLASLDGTNGTTVYGAGKTIYIGGTNSAPSPTGLAAINTLTARGVMVFYNA